MPYINLRFTYFYLLTYLLTRKRATNRKASNVALTTVRNCRSIDYKNLLHILLNLTKNLRNAVIKPADCKRIRGYTIPSHRRTLVTVVKAVQGHHLRVACLATKKQVPDRHSTT